MKSVCKYCGNKDVTNWGERRRYCSPCDRTFRVPKAGRKKSKNRDMYLLDRSTLRRIGSKTHFIHTTVMRSLHKELGSVSTPLENLKKT